MGSTPEDGQRTFALGDVVATADGHHLGTLIMVHEDELVVESSQVRGGFYIIDRAEIYRRQAGRLINTLTLEEAKAREQP